MTSVPVALSKCVEGNYFKIGTDDFQSKIFFIGGNELYVYVFSTKCSFLVPIIEIE